VRSHLQPATKAVALVRQDDTTALRVAPYVEPGRESPPLHLEHIGEVGVDLQDQPCAYGHVGSDQEIVVERAANLARHLEEHPRSLELSARRAELRVLELPRGAGVPRSLASEQLVGVPRNGEPVRRQHTCVGGEQAVQLLGAKLSVESACERHALSEEHVDGMRDADLTHFGT
jgi:hypothetical protein